MINKNLNQRYSFEMGNQVYPVDPRLVRVAAEALKDDQKISREEYNQLIEAGLANDGALTEVERQFIGQLDNPVFARQVQDAVFNPVQSEAKFSAPNGPAELEIDGKIQSVRNIGLRNLQRNLTMGRRVEQEVASQIVSSNQFSNIQQTAVSVLNAGSVILARTEINRLSQPDPQLDSPPANIKAGHDYLAVHHISRVTSKHLRGNCFEKAAVAAIALANRQAGPVEIFSQIRSQPTFGIADHAFVVIGRDPSSDVRDPKTWGPTAVVVDPWKQQTYPASQHEIPVNYQLIRTDLVAEE